ncbi:tail fiber protein [Achromobacter insuavis]|uniref:Tail fiber protein 2 n=1 Tax=Achromobacter insuavis AXX-A TaxID=1003200 RepID=F7SVN5_9BURK|nr:tail fiber protein [Achromobacter insuavis]EGP47816.1 Tail fiber protein 2 [Achromobacter insuavis AXX-A]
MQFLKPINVGQVPNDQTGDTLRDAMALVNENFAKTRVGVEAVEVSAAAAQRKADAAVPASEKGATGGVTPLDAAGKVPAAHLPPPAIPLSEKSAPGGVAPLDASGKVPAGYLPVPGDFVPRTEKGASNGVMSLDSSRRAPPANSRYPDLQSRPDGTDFNELTVADDYYIRASAPNAPPGWTGQGMLRVQTYANMTLQEVIRWSMEPTRWWRMRADTTGTWSSWKKVVAEGEAMRRVRLVSGTAVDASTLTADNTLYAWSNSNVMGANFPNIVGAGYLYVTIMASDLLSQELTITMQGRKPYVFHRLGNPMAGGIWQQWRVVGPFSTATIMPNFDAGDIYVDGAGWYEWKSGAYQLRAMAPAIPVASVSWWPLRASIPAGQIPADGQTVSRATFPDLAAMVTGGKVPVVTEADWLADPLKRGSYTFGDGAATIRVPDLNGQSQGSLGAVFRRGDGALSSGTNGLIQRDALQNIAGTFAARSGTSTGIGAVAAGTGAFERGFKDYGSGVGHIAYASTDGPGDTISFSAAKVARTATETRSMNVSGVWTIQAFGAVTNPGSVDLAQLASDFALQNARLQALDDQLQTLRDQTFGVGQTFQNVTASRVFDLTVYTNTTSRAIVIYIGYNLAGSGVVEVQLRAPGGSVWLPGVVGGWATPISGMTTSCVIPPGASYRMQKGSACTVTNVYEYR